MRRDETRNKKYIEFITWYIGYIREYTYNTTLLAWGYWQADHSCFREGQKVTKKIIKKNLYLYILFITEVQEYIVSSRDLFFIFSHIYQKIFSPERGAILEYIYTPAVVKTSLCGSEPVFTQTYLEFQFSTHNTT